MSAVLPTSSLLLSPGAAGQPDAGLRFTHRMPFGPCLADEREPSAGYLFRLWAPAARQVEVCIVGPAGERRCEPCIESEGWHRGLVADACPGDLYVFRLDGRLEVPDPVSRFNPRGVHGPSQLVDPAAFEWDADWKGRSWEEVVIYELHIGSFTPEGRYTSAETRLDELAALGITAIELMPLGAFSGRRGWGYDGVLPFAPAACYGTPDELKHFIQAAHRCGLMVFLDVVYNHFGPDGNYLQRYAPQFFTTAHLTAWGAAIDYEGPDSARVRDFFIHNALYWLEEYRFDGLRLDAVHAIFDCSEPPILAELSSRVRRRIRRQVHLMFDSSTQEAALLAVPGTPGRYDAQWNDRFHHAAHVLVSTEGEGGCADFPDFADQPVQHLVRGLAAVDSFQGSSAPVLPPSAFINFLQNHAQVGKRAFGERLVSLADPQRLRIMVALQLLAPSPPLIFMGEEAGATTPFLYFCDYPGALGAAMREGRRRECAALPRPPGSEGRALPDPSAEESFLASQLDWAARASPEAQSWLAFYRELLVLRQRMVLPRLQRAEHPRCRARFAGSQAFELCWPGSDGLALVLQANFGSEVSLPLPGHPGRPFVVLGPEADQANCLAPCTLRAWVAPAEGGV